MPAAAGGIVFKDRFQGGQGAIKHVGGREGHVSQGWCFEGPDVRGIEGQTVRPLVHVGRIQPGVVGGEIRQHHPLMARCAFEFLEAITPSKRGRREGLGLALEPPVVRRRSTDQGALKGGERTGHDVGVKRSVKPFMGPFLILEVLSELVHQFNQVAVEFGRLLHRGEHLGLERRHTALPVKSGLPCLVDQGRGIPDPQGPRVAWRHGQGIGHGQGRAVAAGAAEHAIRREPFVEEEESSEFPFGLVQRVVCGFEVGRKVRGDLANVRHREGGELRLTAHEHEYRAREEGMSNRRGHDCRNCIAQGRSFVPSGSRDVVLGPPKAARHD